jgi:hypothetical protein
VIWKKQDETSPAADAYLMRVAHHHEGELNAFEHATLDQEVQKGSNPVVLIVPVARAVRHLCVGRWVG